MFRTTALRSTANNVVRQSILTTPKTSIPTRSFHATRSAMGVTIEVRRIGNIPRATKWTHPAVQNRCADSISFLPFLPYDPFFLVSFNFIILFSLSSFRQSPFLWLLRPSPRETARTSPSRETPSPCTTSVLSSPTAPNSTLPETEDRLSLPPLVSDESSRVGMRVSPSCRLVRRLS